MLFRYWIEFRKTELGKSIPVRETKKEGPVAEEVMEPEKNSSSDNLIDFIKKNDKGDGVDFKDMLQIKNSESIIEMMLKEGDIFEVRPGRFKVLE